MRHLGDATATKIIDQFKVSVADKTVAIDFHASAEDVWAHLQKVIKDIKQMHHHHAAMHPGMHPGMKPKPEKCPPDKECKPAEKK